MGGLFGGSQDSQPCVPFVTHPGLRAGMSARGISPILSEKLEQLGSRLNKVFIGNLY